MKRQRGTVAVEAALGLPLLILMVLAWLEFCVLTYAMAATDHALATAVNAAKRQGSLSSTVVADYEYALLQALRENGIQWWMSSEELGAVRAEVVYFSDLSALAQCSQGDAELQSCAQASSSGLNASVAVYQVDYRYQPMFNVYLPELRVHREVVAVQEYQRCKFKYWGGCDG
ncbi:TadE/TadG family type IV pilus assembly protein [Ferrimonas sp. SCSIO 43195]|uniref:TadE/TadG family type IV pilus assembly protein n=1 Tax=Ferrimonas sp. SCSIO 43195 TaxID=2822844 RepID=UPI002075E1E1|nr:TadE/TadG family type IV pilus assembly protein [Ferrimonas sp. SCSIO 43195]USD38920.1 pilus assembly protein [Ferrimonas sp. SCSIO 43195]